MTAQDTLLCAAETYQRDTLLALADEAYDRSDIMSEKGYRWLARQGKWPMRRSGGGLERSYWYWAYTSRSEFSEAHELPVKVWEAYPGISGPLTFKEVMSWGAKKVGMECCS